MIVVLSVINGFEKVLRERFLAANAHILVYSAPYGIKNYRLWASRIKNDFADEVKGTSPFIHYETMARTGSNTSSVLIRGINPNKREKVQSLKNLVYPKTALALLQKELDNGASDTPAIVLGKGLLKMLGGKVGEEIHLVSPNENNFSNQQVFKVVGIYDSGLRHYDNRVGIISLTSAQQLFGYDGRVTGVEVGLHHPHRSKKIAKKIEQRYLFSVAEWQSFNRPFFEAMERERVVIMIIVALVAVVAIFNIFTTLFVSVTQKMQDISILKSLGATNRQVNAIVLKQGCLIGIVGNFFGIILAFLACLFLTRYPIVSLPEKIYHISKLPIEFDVLIYLGVFCVSILCCAIAGFYPARIATYTSPMEILRNRNV